MAVLDEKLYKHINLLLKRYSVLESAEESIIQAYLMIEKSYLSGGKLLIAGNGGSAADGEHIVGELMKGFKMKREISAEFKDKLISINAEMGEKLSKDLQGGLPAISLNNHLALNSAFLNDVDGLKCYAQQLYVYGKSEDVFLGITTSGNSKNVIYAALVAKAKGMKIIGLTGERKGKLDEYADVVIKVPNTETYMIQELHLPVYHCLCLMLEERFFGN